MPTAFVTGATGFLGRHLVEQLCAARWRVVCFHRPASDVSALRPLGVELAAGTLHDPASVAAAMPEGADAVFHVAANTSTWSRHEAAQTRDNVEGTRAVIAAARQRGARRLVHTSTWGTFGHGSVPEIDETTPQQAAGSWINYERSKWLAEQEVRAAAAAGLPAVILCPPHLMGRYDAHNWARLIRMAHRGTLPGVPPGAGMFASGEEVARTHLAAATQGRPGALYLLTGAPGSFLDVVRIVCELAGQPRVPRVVPAFALRTLARLKALGAALTGREPDVTPQSAEFVIARMTIRSTLAEQELGHRVRPLRAVVEEAWRWLQAEGLL